MGSALLIILNILPSTLSNLERASVLFAIFQTPNTYTGHLTDKIIPFLPSTIRSLRASASYRTDKIIHTFQIRTALLGSARFKKLQYVY